METDFESFNHPIWYLVSLFIFIGWSVTLCVVNLFRWTTLHIYQFSWLHQEELICQCPLIHPLPKYEDLPDHHLPTYTAALSLVYKDLPEPHPPPPSYTAV